MSSPYLVKYKITRFCFVNISNNKIMNVQIRGHKVLRKISLSCCHYRYLTKMISMIHQCSTYGIILSLANVQHIIYHCVTLQYNLSSSIFHAFHSIKSYSIIYYLTKIMYCRNSSCMVVRVYGLKQLDQGHIQGTPFQLKDMENVSHAILWGFF